MLRQELLDGRRVLGRALRRAGRAQERQELLPRARREEGRRVRDHVRVLASTEVEADRDAARVGLRVRVRDVRDAGRAGEAHRDRGRGVVEVFSATKRSGCGRGREGAAEEGATGVDWRVALVGLIPAAGRGGGAGGGTGTESRMRACDGLERGDDAFARLHDLLVC